MVNSSVKIPAGCVFLNGLPVLKLVFIDLDATSIQIIHEKEFCFHNYAFECIKFEAIQPMRNSLFSSYSK